MNIIEGLKIKLSTQKLASLVSQRIIYHESRCKFYREEIAKFKNNGIIVDGMSGNPLNSIENSLKSHKDKLAFLSFFHSNMVENSDYLLSEHECRTLELI